MSNVIAHRTGYIQKLFLNIQTYLVSEPSMPQLIQRLNQESPEYRSIAYESASMGIAFADVTTQKGLDRWQTFIEMVGIEHAFHLDIGLGWAMGKAGILASQPEWQDFQAIRSLVLDGMGYYYALYRGRRTLKQAWLPFELSPEDQIGFDSGVGRRIWYVCQGEITQIYRMLDVFPNARKPGLWRGLGIACGYVGGTEEECLQTLLEMVDPYRSHFEQGIFLAGISRMLSHTYEEPISNVCQQVCGLSQSDIQADLEALSSDWFAKRSQYSLRDITFFHDNTSFPMHSTQLR